MGSRSGAAPKASARGSATSRTDVRVRDSVNDLSGNIEMESDENVHTRGKAKRGDLRSNIAADLRNEISGTHNRTGIDLRNSIGGDLRDEISNTRNRAAMDNDESDTPSAITSGKVQGLNRKPSELNDAHVSKGAPKPIFAKQYPIAPVPSVTSIVQVSPASSVGADAHMMPPPKPKIFAVLAKPIGIRHSEHDGGGNMPPPIASKSRIFGTLPVFKPKTPPAAAQDQGSQHGGSLTPKVSPQIRPHTALPVHGAFANSISSSVPGFKFGDEFLKHCAQIVDSREYKARFRNEQDGSLAEMHDDMCHPKEWEERERTSVHNTFQTTFETAYSDSELRRETNLTNLYRSIKGIKKTLDHIQKTFKGDTKDGRDQFSVSIYPTLRAAEIDLKNVGNRVYSKEYIVTVERMIKFCMHMYFLTTKVSDGSEVPDMHSKSLEYAQKFMDCLMDAYQEMWAHHIMPPNSEEFCSLSLATSALARAATGNNKGGGLAGLCKTLFMLPSHIRQKSQVRRTLDVLLCYFGDNITRFFELLENGCPYLVVLMVSSEFYQIRCRFMKNFFVINQPKESPTCGNIPFETLARFVLLFFFYFFSFMCLIADICFMVYHQAKRHSNWSSCCHA